MGALPAYTALTDSYAEVMADIPYPAWFAFIAQYLPPPSTAGTRARHWVAELFSGPGVLAACAKNAGYRPICLDNHFPFLKKIHTHRICADAAALPFADRSLAAVCAVNCSIHYLPDAGTLGEHFRECRRALGNGGIYAFDVCPPERALGLHARRFLALNGEVSFAHRYQSALQRLETTVELGIGRDSTVRELHVQRIFSQDEISAAAAEAGFSVQACVANYGLPVGGDNIPIMTWVLR